MSDNSGGVPQTITVTLTPQQAHHVAESLRLELVLCLEKSLPSARLGREDAEGIRLLLTRYCEQLNTLDWGRPVRDVELVCERDRLNDLAGELLEAGQEELCHPHARAGAIPFDVRRQAMEKVGAAEVIAKAVLSASTPSPTLVSGAA